MPPVVEDYAYIAMRLREITQTELADDANASNEPDEDDFIGSYMGD